MASHLFALMVSAKQEDASWPADFQAKQGYNDFDWKTASIDVVTQK